MGMKKFVVPLKAFIFNCSACRALRWVGRERALAVGNLVAAFVRLVRNAFSHSVSC